MNFFSEPVLSLKWNRRSQLGLHSEIQPLEGPVCPSCLPKPRSNSTGLRLQLTLTLLFLCFFCFVLFFVVFFFFLNPQLWCDFDKSIPLKNLTFNSSAVFTDICSYPEVFIHELPSERLGLRHLHQLRIGRTGWGALDMLALQGPVCPPLPLPPPFLLLPLFCPPFSPYICCFSSVSFLISSASLYHLSYSSSSSPFFFTSSSVHALLSFASPSFSFPPNSS